MSRPTMIIDTGIGDLHPTYADTFRHIRLTRIEHPALVGPPYHEHAAMVLSVLASNFNEPHDVISVRNLTSKGGGHREVGYDYLLDVIRDAKPARIVMSQGIADGDDRLNNQFLEQEFRRPEFVDTWLQTLEDADATIFFASGNSDQNDDDPDIDYPQRVLVESPRVVIAGACDYRGKPARFSGDGRGVLAMWLGVNRATMEGQTGEWVGANGTSFAAPDAAGESLVSGLTGADFHEHAKRLAVAPLGIDRPHPKGGYGSMVRGTQINLMGSGLYPAIAPSIASWHDFKQIEDIEPLEVPR